MITITEDALDDLSQMNRPYVNLTALNFRDVSPEIHSNYNTAFNVGKMNDIAHRLSIRDRLFRSGKSEFDEPTWHPGMQSEDQKPWNPFAEKIKNGVLIKISRDDEDNFFSNPENRHFVNTTYANAKELFNQHHQSEPENQFLPSSAMVESTSIGRDTLNLIYNYGKSELKKDIFAFGKQHVLK